MNGTVFLTTGAVQFGDRQCSKGRYLFYIYGLKRNQAGNQEAPKL
jgi:hypothetical protein